MDSKLYLMEIVRNIVFGLDVDYSSDICEFTEIRFRN